MRGIASMFIALLCMLPCCVLRVHFMWYMYFATKEVRIVRFACAIFDLVCVASYSFDTMFVVVFWFGLLCFFVSQCFATISSAMLCFVRFCIFRFGLMFVSLSCFALLCCCLSRRGAQMNRKHCPGSTRKYRYEEGCVFCDWPFFPN